MKERVSQTVRVISLFLFLIGCTPKVHIYHPPPLWPEPIDKLINDKYQHSITAVGIATHPQKEIAILQAESNARHMLAKHFVFERMAFEKEAFKEVDPIFIAHCNQELDHVAALQELPSHKVKHLVKVLADSTYEAYCLYHTPTLHLLEYVDSKLPCLFENPEKFKECESYQMLLRRVEQEKAMLEDSIPAEEK